MALRSDVAAAPAQRELTIRLASALVLAPLVLLAVWAGGYWFTALIALAALAAGIEWSRLTCATTPRVGQVLPAIAAGAVVLWAFTSGAAVTAWLVLGAGYLWFRAGTARPWALAGVTYICLPFLAFLALRERPEDGLFSTIWLLVVVWSTDIGAYFAGRAIGGPKIWQRVSPSKTWAGLAGGMAAAALFCAILVAADGRSGVLLAAVAGAFLAVVAQAGDFLESAVKRHFGAKDSGNLIPGHGGILDRIDGLLAAALGLWVISVVGSMPWR